MVSVASQLIEEVTAHAQNDSIEDAREMCADGSFFPNNLRLYIARCTCWLLTEFACLCKGLKAYGITSSRLRCNVGTDTKCFD